MSFELAVDDVKFFKQCVDAIVNLIDEGTLELGPDEVGVRAMDPSQIAMVVFSLPKKAFSAYKVAGESMRIGVNFSELGKVLARARSGDKLTLKKDENKLVLEFKGEGHRRKFSLPLLEAGAAAQREPKIEHDALVKMKGGEFKDLLRDVALVSTHLTLEAKGNSFSVFARGDSAELESEAEKSEKKGSAFEVDAKKEARATFPLQYLDDIVKACPEDSILTTHLRTNAPVKIEYKIGDASLTYYLAPRIESE